MLILGEESGISWQGDVWLDFFFFLLYYKYGLSPSPPSDSVLYMNLADRQQDSTDSAHYTSRQSIIIVSNRHCYR